MKISLQHNIWNGRKPLDLELPETWDVTVVDIPADKLPAMTEGDIRQRLENPIGMKPLRELAVGKKKVCIVFDDASRPTPCGQIAHQVLKILFEAGVKKENIFFLCAPGTHGVHNRKQFVDKLGEEIVRDYVILNHDVYDKCTSIGVSKEGIDVKVNNEFVTADLRIGIGCLMPHGMSGFSGGYRMMVPGLCHIDTTEAIHRLVTSHTESEDMTTLSGHKENMYMHNMIADMGRMLDNFVKIDCIVNSRLELVDCFVGEPLEQYKAAAVRGEELMTIPKPDQAYDIVIANINAKVSYAGMGIATALPFVAPTKGDIIAVNFAYEGQIPHYLRGYWGDASAPRIPVEGGMQLPCRVIYYSPYADRNAVLAMHLEHTDHVLAPDWETVLGSLTKTKPDARVCVLTEASLAAM